jgi:hypothetical protein
MVQIQKLVRLLFFKTRNLIKGGKAKYISATGKISLRSFSLLNPSARLLAMRAALEYHDVKA